MLPDQVALVADMDPSAVMQDPVGGEFCVEPGSVNPVSDHHRPGNSQSRERDRRFRGNAWARNGAAQSCDELTRRPDRGMSAFVMHTGSA